MWNSFFNKMKWYCSWEGSFVPCKRGRAVHVMGRARPTALWLAGPNWTWVFLAELTELPLTGRDVLHLDKRSQPSCVGLSRIGSLLEDRGGEFACLQPSWAVSGSTAQDSWVRITVLTELLLARPRVSQLGASHAPTVCGGQMVTYPS